VEPSWGGAVFYEATEAERILQCYARLAAAAPDELSTQALIVLAPPLPFILPQKQGIPVVAILVCYTGDLTEGERVVAPLRRLADVIAPMPYPAIFAFMEVGEIRGLQHHVRSLFLETLSSEALHTLVDASLAILSPETLILLRVLGGALSRVATDATAFAHRDKQALVLVTNFGPPSTDPATRMQRVWQALSPYADGVYVNFLADEGEARVYDAYPPSTYMRLAALKKRYDPTNLFHLNQNIKPVQ
jgi:Berberine and berberine like